MMKKTTQLHRFLCILCALALLVSCLPAAVAYGASSGWAKSELDRMEELGLIPEELQAKEDLRVAITRLEMCSIAVTALETYTGQDLLLPGKPPFSDTDSEIAGKAYAAGLIQGYEDGTFRPDNLLTRQEFFSFVYNFLVAAGWVPTEDYFADLSVFPDANTVASWALEATHVVVGIGVVKGDGQGLAPRATATCEQALAMFLRAYTFLDSQVSGETVNQPPANTLPGSPSLDEKYPNLQSWAKGELAEMDGLGLIPEILIGRDMSSPITRGEMCYAAVTAYQKLRTEEPVFRSESSPFSDVDDPMITLAYDLGLVSGFPDGTFLPDIPITREQFFRITVNFLNALDYPYTDNARVNLSVFTDAGKVSDYAKPSARLLVGLGIVQGSNSRLTPKSSTQCQQALAMFFRSYKYLLAWQEQQANPEERPEADALVEFALRYEGYPYIWGGKSPSTGFDCSGFVWYVYTSFGYTDLGRTATAQWYYEYSWEVNQDSLLPGDLVFFSDSCSIDDITHVGIYIGDGEFIHAANSKSGVIITSTSSSYYSEKFVGARRIIE